MAGRTLLSNDRRVHAAYHQYDVNYFYSSYLTPLARLGYEYQEPKGLPRVAPAEKHIEFIAMYVLLLSGLGTDDAVYFVDAVHQEYKTRSRYGWVKAGSNSVVTTIAGSGSVNIYGAFNL